MSNASPTSVRTFELAQRLPLGFSFPARMTALALTDGGVALVSPIPITESIARELDAMGEVRFLVAPNLLHHLYLDQAIAWYPAARVLAPPGLERKRPELRIDLPLGSDLPGGLRESVVAIPIDGVPSFGEVALFHSTSRTLVLTDFVFHIVKPEGLVAHIVLALVGCHGRLGQSRVWRLATKNRDAFARSTARLLELPFERLVVAHGEVVTDDARERLRGALPRVPLKALPAR